MHCTEVFVSYWIISFPLSLILLFVFGFRFDLRTGVVVIWGSLALGNILGCITEVAYMIGGCVDWKLAVDKSSARIRNTMREVRGYQRAEQRKANGRGTLKIAVKLCGLKTSDLILALWLKTKFSEAVSPWSLPAISNDLRPNANKAVQQHLIGWRQSDSHLMHIRFQCDEEMNQWQNEWNRRISNSSMTHNIYRMLDDWSETMLSDDWNEYIDFTKYTKSYHNHN